MRLLFVTPSVPADHGNGLRMRQGQFLQAFARDFTIDLAVIAVAGVADMNDDFINRHVCEKQMFSPWDFAEHSSLLARLQNRFLRLDPLKRFSRPNMLRMLTPQLLDRFLSWLGDRRYDTVFISRLYLMEAGLKVRARRYIVDADEDDARVCRQMAKRASRQGDWKAATAHEAEARIIDRFTAKYLPRTDLVFVASQADMRSLKPFGVAARLVPNTVHLPPISPQKPAKPGKPRLMFLGTLGYLPNEEAIRWFIRFVWPGLRKDVPKLELDIIGADASAGLNRAAQQAGINLLGWVRDLKPFYARADIVIVPLLVGGGSRIKMLEAAGYARPVVASTVGAEGSGFSPKRDFLRADTPAAFRAAILTLLRNPQMAGRLGVAGRRAVLQNHDAQKWQSKIAQISRNICTLDVDMGDTQPK